jgi:hypothetical protein
MQRKKPNDRRIYEVTRRYQRFYPELIEGKLAHGRVSLKKRAQMIYTISKIAMNHTGLFKIYKSKRFSDKEKKKIAAKYLINLNKGNAVRAKSTVVQMLDRIFNLNEKLYAKFSGPAYLEKIAKKQGLIGKDIRNYCLDTHHVMTTPLVILADWLSGVEQIIDLEVKKQK